MSRINGTHHSYSQRTHTRSMRFTHFFPAAIYIFIFFCLLFHSLCVKYSRIAEVYSQLETFVRYRQRCLFERAVANTKRIQSALHTSHRTQTGLGFMKCVYGVCMCNPYAYKYIIRWLVSINTIISIASHAYGIPHGIPHTDRCENVKWIWLWRHEICFAKILFSIFSAFVSFDSDSNNEKESFLWVQSTSRTHRTLH